MKQKLEVGDVVYCEDIDRLLIIAATFNSGLHTDSCVCETGYNSDDYYLPFHKDHLTLISKSDFK